MLPSPVDVALGGLSWAAGLRTKEIHRYITTRKHTGAEAVGVQGKWEKVGEDKGSRARARRWRTYGELPPRLAFVLRTGPIESVGMFMRSSKERAAMAHEDCGEREVVGRRRGVDCPRQ